MTTTSRLVESALSALALAAVTMPFALAQSTEATQEVQITAFKPILTTGRDVRGGPVEMVQLSRRVSFADLNIATYSGATELHKRIASIARDVCHQLEQKYPGSTDLPSGSCVSEAINSAMAQANAAIAAAERATLREAEAPQK